MTKETDYIEQYRELHQQDKDYGISGSNYYEEICLVIDYLKPKTVLDYGCGKAVLITQLEKKYPNIKFYGYDPAIPERSILPIDKVDLVLNTDVLEHIPEDILPSVVERISHISDKCFFGIHHALAYTILPNGENAHCTVKPIFWYYHLFEKFFSDITVLRGSKSYFNTVLTFPVKPHFILNYESLIDKQKNFEFNETFTKLKQKNSDLDLKVNDIEEKLDNLRQKLKNLLKEEKKYKKFSFLGLLFKIRKK